MDSLLERIETTGSVNEYKFVSQLEQIEKEANNEQNRNN